MKLFEVNTLKDAPIDVKDGDIAFIKEDKQTAVFSYVENQWFIFCEYSLIDAVTEYNNALMEYK